MNLKKPLFRSLNGAIATVILASTAAMAGLTVLEQTPGKTAVPPQVVVEEGTRMRAENERLSREIDQMTNELSQVQNDLLTLKGDEQTRAAKLAKANRTLDQIVQRMEKVGTALLRINFRVNSSKFEPTREVGEALLIAAAQARRVNVHGHTDNTGTKEANRAIALARALSAKKYMTDNGIAANKVFIFSRASKEPVMSNNTKEGRRQNRRVDIKFIR